MIHTICVFQIVIMIIWKFSFKSKGLEGHSPIEYPSLQTPPSPLQTPPPIFLKTSPSNTHTTHPLSFPPSESLFTLAHPLPVELLPYFCGELILTSALSKDIASTWDFHKNEFEEPTADMISWFEGRWSDMLSFQYSTTVSRWERSIGTDIARINKLRDTLRWGSIRCAVPCRRTVEKINILDWSEVPPLFWTPPRIHLNNSGQLSKCPLVLVSQAFFIPIRFPDQPIYLSAASKTAQNWLKLFFTKHLLLFQPHSIDPISVTYCPFVFLCWLMFFPLLSVCLKIAIDFSPHRWVSGHWPCN